MIRFEIFRSPFCRQWRWRLRGANGRILATSGESFHNRGDCLSSLDLVRSTNAGTPIVEKPSGREVR